MIQFHFSCPNPASQFVEITMSISPMPGQKTTLQLPAWRAGRYQIADYAQNIRGFKVWNQDGKPLAFKKFNKNVWEIDPVSDGPISVSYCYWAGKMDAGNSWADDEQVYINFVNCCFEVLGQSDQEIQVSWDFPSLPDQVSTLLEVNGPKAKALNFQMLADSTLLAAKTLTHWTYFSGNTQFNIWIKGEVFFDQPSFMKSFQAFSQKLIEDFGEFPEKEYHFIFQLLRYPHYHGVEHRRGTVITFGPAESLKEPEQMEELLGVSCHELYHAWNVCRIRPEELLPYDFSKETYTQVGLVLEGVTTYMGDLYLLKSGVYSPETYLRHFGKVIQREADSFGWQNYSILESSFDLWLDGYQPGIPNRKVNIYTRGAILAFCLDVMLLESGSSLAEVMKSMWEAFGKPNQGYQLKDFKTRITQAMNSEKVIESFFSDFVEGYEDLFPVLEKKLSQLGIGLRPSFTDDMLLHQVGIRSTSTGKVQQIHLESQAYEKVMINDQIVEDHLISPEIIKLKINRNNRILEVELNMMSNRYFPINTLVLSRETELYQRWSK
ncbi:M61 family metallopeptidase [Algoriphagus taiwanensis]|uniref:PDZ domain-containing protein n=1 Tax=Algoriphagus taiwanensis TaxID=1445656 RepID=A0ABQ6Q514_9BACT|nr:PDZ domain-containing protein [Algoriphagus taiwanensis]